VKHIQPILGGDRKPWNRLEKVADKVLVGSTLFRRRRGVLAGLQETSYPALGDYCH